MEAGSPEFQKVLNDPKHEIQIIYGQINGDDITHYSLGDSSQYFYPASTVKMIAAFAAVVKLQELNLPLTTEIIVDSTEYHPRVLHYDSLFQGPITVENLIKKIFVYSDNQAFNILYGWLGKDYINKLQDTMGIPTRIQHQLSESAFSFTNKSNTTRNSTLLVSDGDIVKTNTETVSWTSSLKPANQEKGQGYIDGEGNLLSDKFDFSVKNYVPLNTLLGSLERMIFPDFFPPSYDLDEEYRNHLIRLMELLPSDLPDPIPEYGNNYVKFFMFGDGTRKQPEHIKILNKVGVAYGYLTDVAYITDSKNGIEFFLAATIHVNENEIYNDGNYEYDEVGIPFLTELGQLIYQNELERYNQ